MRNLSSLIIFFMPNFLLAQFNLENTTAAFLRQQNLLAHADSLFINGKQCEACILYDEIFIDCKDNWHYGIRRIRCKSLHEPPSRKMIEYLYSIGISKDTIASDYILGSFLAGELSRMVDKPTLEGRYKKMLDSIAFNDQRVRSGDVLEAEMMQVDSINYNLLLSCFRDTGTYINSLGAILVLTHTLALNPHDMNFMMNILNRALLNGSIDPETYALIVDHTCYGLFRCVPFGVFGSDKVKLARCVDDKTTETYRTRLLGKNASDLFAK